jgi:hypothetical protein
MATATARSTDSSRASRLQQSRASVRGGQSQKKAGKVYQMSDYVKRNQSANTPQPNIEADRKAHLAASRVQSAPVNVPTPQSTNIEPSAPQSSQTQSSREVFKQSILGKIIARSTQNRSQSRKEAQKNARIEKTREEVKKTAKAAMKRGFMYVLGIFGISLDGATAGVSFIINSFYYMFSLAWLNLEMIYGTHFAKKKSKFIGPLSWAPIPMPVDKDALILQGFVVAADLAFVVAIVIAGAGGMCFLNDFIAITTSPILVGQSLATGGGGLCLGSIWANVFSL